MFEWPNGSLVLPAVAEKIVAVSMLAGDTDQLEFEQLADGVKIMLPESAPNEIASVVRIELDASAP